MTTLSWKLSTMPAQTPEYWLLFIDGSACTSLASQAPYTGPGTYSVDLTRLDKGSPVPTDGAAHLYSVALVGQNSVGPQSAAISITLPPPAIVAVLGAQQLPQAVWPAADSVTLT
jgi:hypothetical protein